MSCSKPSTVCIQEDIGLSLHVSIFLSPKNNLNLLLPAVSFYGVVLCFFSHVISDPD